MRLLRAPGGCPWDREQTHRSVRANFIEETYEAVEAIDTDNAQLLEEELGDVLLQVVLHARMEEEAGRFSFADVVNGVARKLVLRHPHVFGDVTVSDTGQVLDNWDAIKKQSKNQQTTAEVLKSVSPALPALMRSDKLQKKAEKGLRLIRRCKKRKLPLRTAPRRRRNRQRAICCLPVWGCCAGWGRNRKKRCIRPTSGLSAVLKRPKTQLLCAVLQSGNSLHGKRTAFGSPKNKSG